jgi:predicted MFS family arabinose efflux permease
MSIIFGLFISLCGFNYGYGLSACSVINTPQVMQIYGIPTSLSTTHSLLIGLMPVGGIFGAIFNQVFIKYVSRKYSIIYMTIILWVGLALMLIENYITLFVGRFIEGFALALFLSIGPIYLK